MQYPADAFLQQRKLEWSGWVRKAADMLLTRTIQVAVRDSPKTRTELNGLLDKHTVVEVSDRILYVLSKRLKSGLAYATLRHHVKEILYVAQTKTFVLCTILQQLYDRGLVELGLTKKIWCGTKIPNLMGLKPGDLRFKITAAGWLQVQKGAQ